MSESALTPHTAPRDLDSLLRETPFKLRLLAQSLGGLTTEEQKMAWHQLNTSEARANHILAMLRAWDATNPGQARAGGAPAAAPQTNGAHAPAAPQAAPQQQFQAPFQMPMTQIAPTQAPGAPPQVSPQAAAGAQAAAGSDKKNTRSPRTSGGANAEAGAELGGQVITLLNTILNGLKADADQRQGFQQSLTAMLESVASDKTSRVTALESKYGEMHETLKHLSAAMQSQSNLQLWTLMAFLTLASEQTGGGVVEILRAAIGDSAMMQKLVDQATGKA